LVVSRIALREQMEKKSQLWSAHYLDHIIELSVVFEHFQCNFFSLHKGAQLINLKEKKEGLMSKRMKRTSRAKPSQWPRSLLWIDPHQTVRREDSSLWSGSQTS